MNERASAQFCFRLLNEPRTTPRMVVNSGSTFLKRIELTKKMYGITSAGDAPHPAGDLRSPNERHIQFGLCTWRGGMFLGAARDEHTGGARQVQEIFAGADEDCEQGRSSNETSPARLGTIRDDSVGGLSPLCSETHRAVQE